MIAGEIATFFEWCALVLALTFPLILIVGALMIRLYMYIQEQEGEK